MAKKIAKKVAKKTVNATKAKPVAKKPTKKSAVKKAVKPVKKASAKKAKHVEEEPDFELGGEPIDGITDEVMEDDMLNSDDLELPDDEEEEAY